MLNRSARLGRQLESRRLIIKNGTFLDASVIEAAAKKPNQKEDGLAGSSSADPEVDWTQQCGRYHFGYKAYVGVNPGSVIRRIVITPAHVQDWEMYPHVICADEGWGFADKT
jgi:transposase, IS5 family